MTSGKVAPIAKTEVCITVDVEFDIAGTFVDPDRFAPIAEQNVWCREGEESHGLGFLLSTLGGFEISATFFVEALNSVYFGDEPMREIAKTIARVGHDVQLHLHPVWTYFEDPAWRDRLAHVPPNDSFVGRSRPDTERLIERGRTTFSRWGIGDPVALRTGGLHVDSTVYEAMNAQGMALSSNIGVGIYQPEADALQLYAGRHLLSNVVEVPVLTYRRRGFPKRRNEKTLTITGTSWRETKRLLLEAHRAGVGPVVLLTHPHEFAKPDGNGGWRANPVNQRRLRQVCEFLAEHGNAFDVVTFGERAATWQKSTRGREPILSVPAIYGVSGILENLYNDWFLAFGALMLCKASSLAQRLNNDGLPGAGA